MSSVAKMLLDIRSVNFDYFHIDDEHDLLRSVDLTVCEGEVVSIVGKSGVGKSTLLRIMAQQLKPDSGNVTIAPSSSNRLTTLYHPQSANLLPWQSLRENVLLGQRFTGLEPTDDTDAMLDRFDLGMRSASHPAQLSGGQIERVALARTLLTPASVYLLDEPLSGTDYPLRLELEAYLIAFLKRHRSGAVLVTHDVPQALAISDRILLLRSIGGAATHELVAIPDQLGAPDPVNRRANSKFGQTVQKIVDRMEGKR